jgi:hypothetical protein
LDPNATNDKLRDTIEIISNRCRKIDDDSNNFKNEALLKKRAGDIDGALILYRHYKDA